MINIREKIIQSLYEIMCNESGVHDEVDEASDKLEEITCKSADGKTAQDARI